MDATVVDPRRKTGRRNQLRNPAFNPTKVLALAQQGLNAPQIAALQGCNQSTIWRFLDHAKPQSQALIRFKANRADTLATLQAHNLEVQAKVIESIHDGDIKALTPQQKTGLVIALNAQHGTLFDKERLERGQSTSNQSILTSMLNTTVKTLYAETPKGKKHLGKTALNPRPPAVSTPVEHAEPGAEADTAEEASV